MSDTIILSGIHGFGYHGVFDYERVNGQDFYVDLTLDVDLQSASMSDDLRDTINYAKLVDLVVAEIKGEPVSLIEKLAGRIADRVLSHSIQINSVDVSVHKPQAPVGSKVQDIAVRIHRER